MIVYRITNRVNGKVYIGKTHDTVSSRWKQHCSVACNGGGFYLHNALRKYGPAVFSIEVLATASSKEELIELEKQLIASHNSRDPKVGYNLAQGGEGGMSYPGSRNPFFGHRHTDATKELLKACGKIHLGRKRSQLTKDRIANALTGIVRSEITRTRISAAKKGKPGRPISEEERQRLSENKRQWWAARKSL